MANIDFNVDDYEASKPGGPLPAGKYLAIIADTTEKISRNGDRYVELTLEVVHGEHQGQKLWDNLNLWNQSDVARNIARSTLKSICDAVGVKATDTQQLCNKSMVITVAVEDNTYNGQTRKVNRVKGYAKAERPQQPVQQPAPQTYTQQSPW